MSREQNSPAATDRTPSAAPFRSSTPPSAWFVWGAAAFAFAIAVFHRSSLGVAAVPAAERFEVITTGSGYSKGSARVKREKVTSPDLA